MIDNHPADYPHDPNAMKAIASTEEQERRFWQPNIVAAGNYHVTPWSIKQRYVIIINKVNILSEIIYIIFKNNQNKKLYII